MNITPNLNTAARMVYALVGLGLIVWAALGGYRTAWTIALLAGGVVLMAEAGSGW